MNLKIRSLLIIPALGTLSAFAQNDIPKAKTTKVVVTDNYWQDASDDNSFVMNQNKFTDNWFFGIQGGSMMSWNSNSKNNSFMGNQNLAFGVQFGKWLIPYMGFRFHGIYGHNNSKLMNPELSYKWQTWGVSYDLMLDFSNLFFHYKENRFFSVQGFIGVGMNHASRYDTSDERISPPKPNFFNARVGLAASFRINKKLDVNLEVINNWLNSDFDGRPVNNRYDGHADIMLGLTYHIKNEGGTHIFTYARYDTNRYDKLNERIQEMRAQIEGEKTDGVTTPAGTAAVTGAFTESNQISQAVMNLVHTYVTFTDQSSEIAKRQVANVKSAAQNYKKTHSSIYILPNNNSQPAKDREKFAKRANAIKYMLMTDYFVPAGDIFVEYDPKIILNLVEKNPIIVYVNE